MTQEQKTEELLQAHASDGRFDQVWHYCQHARELARKLDAALVACKNCPDSDDARFGLPGQIIDILEVE